METQVGIQRLQIDRPLDTLILQDRLELGGKHNGAFRQDRVVERLLAEAIARQHERTRALVPHGEGEHPAESVNTALPALLVEVHDHLSVRLRTERMPTGAQLISKLDVVVDLAVEGDPDRPVLVRDRLAAAIQVDDREPADRHPERAARIESPLIWTAVEHRVRHPVQQIPVDGGAVEVILARDPAHTLRASASTSRTPVRRTATSKIDRLSAGPSAHPSGRMSPR